MHSYHFKKGNSLCAQSASQKARRNISKEGLSDENECTEKATWWVALILGAAGLIASLVTYRSFPHCVLAVVVGLALLLLATAPRVYSRRIGQPAGTTFCHFIVTASVILALLRQQGFFLSNILDCGVAQQILKQE